MARHNYLVQRSLGLSNYGNDQWLDCCTSNHKGNRGPGVPPMEGRGQGGVDEFGNDGYATLEEARKDLMYFRESYGDGAAYRIIQIVS